MFNKNDDIVQKYKYLIFIYCLSFPITVLVISLILYVSDAITVTLKFITWWEVRVIVLNLVGYTLLVLIWRSMRLIPSLKDGLDKGVFDSPGAWAFARRTIDVLWIVLVFMSLVFVIRLKSEVPGVAYFPLLLIGCIRALELTEYVATRNWSEP